MVWQVFENATALNPGAQYVFEDEIMVRCSDGYRYHGNTQCEQNFTAFCGFDTFFNTPEDSVDCTMVTCLVDELSTPLGTVLELVNEIAYGESVTMQCNTGYRVESHDPAASQTASLKCQQECDIEPAPTCLPVKCNASHLVSHPPPPRPSLNIYSRNHLELTLMCVAQVSDASYVVGELDAENLMLMNTSGLLMCREGFWLDGSSPDLCHTNTTLSCSVDGVLEGLSGSAVCVPVVCGAFVAENATDLSASTDTLYEDDKMVTCNTGYRPSVLPAPRCEVEPGFNVTCSRCGRYEQVPTTCQRIVCNITSLLDYFAENPESGTISTRSTLLGDSVTVSCNAGFLLLSQQLQATAVCGPDCALSLDNDHLKCRPVDCTFPVSLKPCALFEVCSVFCFAKMWN